MRRVISGPTEISIIVPTLNEAANLPVLVARIAATLKGRAYEILVVDDASSDQTVEICERLSQRYPLFLHVRPRAVDGLGGAVVCGLARAQGEYLVVMDADLQHAPESIPDLLAPLQREEAQFVIGSRYVDGAGADQRWGPLRRVNSAIATLLTRPLAGGTRDPMSGFFALRAETFQRAGPLRPIGYKIALELLCKCRVRQVREVPIHFGLRQHGVSKLTLTQRLRFLDHLSQLYDFCFPRGSAWAKFAIVNGCGWLIAFALYVRLIAHDVDVVLAPAIAFAAVVLTSAVFHMRAIRLSGNPGRSRAWADFALVAIGQWSVCTLAARWVAQHVIAASAVEIFAITFGAAAVAGYAERKQLPRQTARPMSATGTQLRHPPRLRFRDAA
ncbi:MAG TPA: polyprenol monophosphomannose synthase [Tepidisphaeraceae bacterium]|jgi:dolichol-phosphate mannosyltransferase|nr:polyprenol monophosphomannose synthase [Tepidisphaeraceae bacterium]